MDAVAALKIDLRMAFFDAVSPGDMREVAEKLRDAALAGDLKAIALLAQLVLAPEPAQTQVAVINASPQVTETASQMLSTSSPLLFRLQAANALKTMGPLDDFELAEELGCSVQVLHLRLNNNSWFTKEPDGWHLTGEAYAELNAAKEDKHG